MRLIDADKLLEDLKQKRYSKQSLELIQSQPEIKAIPISFMRKWENGFMKEINGRIFYMGDGYDTAEDLLEAWEKENEKTDEEHN